ncbi:MAG: hypothetical protein GXZ09_11080 [Syntrophomonadaceae bacterium]|nr:hypothetical protein [Syntrophomonadaceae bacterium]
MAIERAILREAWGMTSGKTYYATRYGKPPMFAVYRALICRLPGHASLIAAFFGRRKLTRCGSWANKKGQTNCPMMKEGITPVTFYLIQLL